MKKVKKNTSLNALLLGEVGPQGSAAGSGSSQKSPSIATDKKQTNTDTAQTGELEI